MRSPGTSRVTSIASVFRQFLTIKDNTALEQERQKELRQRLLEFVDEHGEVDEHGSVFLTLTEPESFRDYKGRTLVYTVLKKERHLTPANPCPDPEKALTLLKRKKLWLSKEDEKLLQEIQLRTPFATVTVEVDPDALTQAYFKNLVSEEDYDACLMEQSESFQFRPLEK